MCSGTVRHAQGVTVACRALPGVVNAVMREPIRSAGHAGAARAVAAPVRPGSCAAVGRPSRARRPGRPRGSIRLRCLPRFRRSAGTGAASPGPPPQRGQGDHPDREQRPQPHRGRSRNVAVRHVRSSRPVWWWKARNARALCRTGAGGQPRVPGREGASLVPWWHRYRWQRPSKQPANTTVDRA